MKKGPSAGQESSGYLMEGCGGEREKKLFSVFCLSPGIQGRCMAHMGQACRHCLNPDCLDLGAKLSYA